MMREAPAFVRPAILQAVLVATASSVALISAYAGWRMQCTALVEFAIVSVIVALSAGTLLTQYAAIVCGLLTTFRPLQILDARLRLLCYAALGMYAVSNAVLDLAVPRRDNDPISYPGMACAVGAVLIVTCVLETKYRVLQRTPSRSLLDSLSDDAFYVAMGIIVLATLTAHIFFPNWWLDTVADAVVVLLVMLRIAALRTSARPAP